jgi:pimeloyl-ACP methyl ester carboxylesterase
MSMGGLNAIVYAGKNSHRLAGLVIIDVGPDLRSVGTNRIGTFMSQAAARDSIEDFVAQALEFNPRRDPVLLRRSLLHNLRQQPDGKWAWKYDRRPMEAAFAHAAKGSREIRNQHLWEDVAGIKCPTLVVRGAESDVFHDEDAEKLVSKLDDARWVKVPNSGHTVQGDNPAALTKALREFLGQIAY